MIKYYIYDEDIKAKMLDRWIRRKEKYSHAKEILIISIIASIFSFFIVYPAIISYAKEIGKSISVPFSVIGISIQVFIASWPFLLGLRIYNKIVSDYGQPFSTMTNEFLRVDNDGLQFGYHDSDTDANVDVYSMKFSDLMNFRYDDEFNILTLIGRADLITYDDSTMDKINYKKSQFGIHKSISFILCFKQNNEIIDLLKSKRMENMCAVVDSYINTIRTESVSDDE